MVLSIRSRRVVSNGGPHLSVAYDLTFFIMIFGLYKLCLEIAWTRLSMVPSIRSRRVVWNGGPHLSVAFLKPYFVTFFELYKLCLKNA